MRKFNKDELEKVKCFFNLIRPINASLIDNKFVDIDNVTLQSIKALEKIELKLINNLIDDISIDEWNTLDLVFFNLYGTEENTSKISQSIQAIYYSCIKSRMVEKCGYNTNDVLVIKRALKIIVNRFDLFYKEAEELIYNNILIGMSDYYTESNFNNLDDEEKKVLCLAYKYVVKQMQNYADYFAENMNISLLISNVYIAYFEQYESYDDTKSEGCYIATAVYGSYYSREVIKLRSFRDNYLRSRQWGVRFINIYYKVSPKLVELFGENKILCKIVRKILDLFIYVIDKF